MNVPNLFELRDEFEILSTGETEELTARQDEFHQLFSPLAEETDCFQEIVFSETVWEYYADTFDHDEVRNIFFERIGEIRSIPSYKYVLKYLLLRYKLAIGKENEIGLWNYLEEKNWKIRKDISSETVKTFKKKLVREKGVYVDSFDSTDYEILLSVVVYYLRLDYQYNGGQMDIKWDKYFKKILFQFDCKLLNEMALALNMEYQVYCVFRKKVLKQSEMNYYDRESILLYLVLKYARTCGVQKYFEAYRMLETLYPQKKEYKNDMIPDSTKVIGAWFTDYLEENGKLKEAYRISLFINYDDRMADVFEMVDAVTRKNSKRSVERIFLEQWEKLESYIEQYEKETIFEKLRLDKEKADSEVSYVGKQKIYRWLYGNKILTREKNRNVELKDTKMTLLGSGEKDYFLNSRTFLETRIRDNTFSAFPKNEERQRNLLLTLGFLNFVLDSYAGNYMAESYSERLVDFEIYIYKLFAPCGFMLLHSGSAYDAYIKLLLSCDEPVELFKYVWRLKTASEE